METSNMTTSELQNRHWTPPVPWSMDPLLGVQTWESEKTSSPKILLVDDDPMFCKAVQRKAKKLQLDLTICKTLGDITKLPSKPEFDVAVLDYFFGEELTAFQISHLFSREVPVVLVSNTEGRKLSGDSWPSEIRTFVHKSAGIDAILAEAFLAAHWGHLVSSLSEAVVPPPASYQTPRWLPLAAALTAGGALALLYFSAHAGKPKFLDWDKAPIQPSRYYSSNLPPQGGSKP